MYRQKSLMAKTLMNYTSLPTPNRMWINEASWSASVHTLAEVTSESFQVVSDSLQPHGLYSPWNSPGQNTGVGSRSLLQGIFPTQGSNAGLPHCRRILYQLSHKGSPTIKIKGIQRAKPNWGNFNVKTWFLQQIHRRDKKCGEGEPTD